MKLHHRKMMPQICNIICHGKNCFKICLPNPQFPYFYPNSPPPPPPPPPPQLSSTHHRKITTFLSLTFTLFAFVFFFLCFRAIYITFRSNRRTLRSPPPPPPSSTIRQIEEIHDQQVDNPIWYIRTLGLNQSVINAITICSYKKDEGLIEGTECVVCLSEFQEDENLRLLPKCYHAFHLGCIDTWLRSHTNCPLCRAPIVNNPRISRVQSLESIVVESNLGSFRHGQINVFDENRGVGEGGGEGESNLGFESSFDSELRNRVVPEEEGQLGACENERQVVVRDFSIGNVAPIPNQSGTTVPIKKTVVATGRQDDVVSVRPRRSISMDDSFVATVVSIESNGNNGDSSRMSLNENSILKVTRNENLATTSKGSSSSSSSFRLTRYLQGVPSSMKRSNSYNGNFLLPWRRRSGPLENCKIARF